MENKKYTKGDKIYKFRATGSGKWTKYVSAISAEEMRLLEFAQFYGFAQSGNDAPRGGKLGDFFEIIKSFDFETLKKAKAEAEAEAKRISDLVLNSEKICDFVTLSDEGSFKIDGVLYSNFWGDGVNRAEICETDEQEFKEANFLTRRQFYAPNEKITIVKFDAPKSITVSFHDCTPSSIDDRIIERALGFVIWSRKLKIFVAKKS